MKKVVLSEKYAQIKHRLQAKMKHITDAILDFDMRGQQGMHFFIVGNVIMDYGLIFWPEAMVLC